MMSDAVDPEVLEAGLPGLPRYGWFAGVLEGRVDEIPPLRAAARRIEALGIVGCDLEVDGGRFSFLFDEAPVPGARLTEEAQASLVDGLQSLVATGSRPGEVESTLRCSLVFDADVVETLFTQVGGEMKPISRRRPLDERDRVHASAVADHGPMSGLESLGRMSRGRGLALLLLVLVGGALYAWKSGYVSLPRDALLSSGAEALVITRGPFGDTLELKVESRFAMYECKVSRGPGYPATAEAVEALLSAAVTAEDRAAANAVGDGNMIWIRLLAADGKTVDAVSVSLRVLLANPDGVIERSLRARLTGARVDLALDSGLTDGRRGNRAGSNEGGR